MQIITRCGLVPGEHDTIAFLVYPQQRVAVTRWIGLISDEDLIPAYRELYSSALWEPGFHELADLRVGDLSSVTGEGLKDLSVFVRKSMGELEGMAKSAVVVEKDLPFGLARMYGAFAEESPETVHVFRTLAEALEWLEVEDLPYS